MLKHFKLSEFNCKCGCGIGQMDEDLLTRLDAFREFLQSPLKVTSGFRCQSHNLKVGGAPKSFHLLGKAADISSTKFSGPGLYRQLQKFAPGMFGGVGVGKNFIHVDVREDSKLFFYDGLKKSNLLSEDK
jgi:zinc D-Ala-D-Ala carboxypeptidase